MNTIVFDAQGHTRGENTDTDGVRLSAAELLGVRGDDRTALVLGTGGAARGAIVGIRDWGAKVYASGRDNDHLKAMIGDLSGIVDPIQPEGLASIRGEVDLLVQCTSQGMHGVDPSGTIVPSEVWKRIGAPAVLDMVYSPGGTELVRSAKDAGIPAVGGDRPLLHQAASGFQLWTGLEAPFEEMEKALSRILAIGVQ